MLPTQFIALIEISMCSQGPKVIPQNKFPIDSNALSWLQEALYCVDPRFDSNYLVIVVKLNDRCTGYNLDSNSPLHFSYTTI